jgi:mobilization protein NikA
VTTEAKNPRTKTMAPWRGRRRIKDARTKLVPVRCTAEERAAIKAVADKAGLSVGAFLRAAALGDAGPRAVRRPPIERKELARLLGHLGKVGSNLNQLAHAFNSRGRVPGLAELERIRGDVAAMRDALMKALGRAGHPGDH